MTDLLGGNWLPVASLVVERGLRLLLILTLALLARGLVRRSLPHVVEATMARGQRSEDEARKRADTIVHVLTRSAEVGIWLIAGFMALSELGVDITPILAGAGVAGVAVGFGAQSLVRDLIAGFFILMENQYGKGDVVNLVGIGGLVEEVNLRRTVLRDLDGTVHSIPNGEIRIASNLTREWSRVNLNIPVAYEEDLDRVTAVINRVGQEMAQDVYFGPLITEAPQVLRVDDFAESAMMLKVLGVTKPIRQWEVMGEFRKRLKLAFDREGIRIPYPHQVVISDEEVTKGEGS